MCWEWETLDHSILNRMSLSIASFQGSGSHRNRRQKDCKRQRMNNTKEFMPSRHNRTSCTQVNSQRPCSHAEILQLQATRGLSTQRRVDMNPRLEPRLTKKNFIISNAASLVYRSHLWEHIMHRVHQQMINRK